MAVAVAGVADAEAAARSRRTAANEGGEVGLATAGRVEFVAENQTKSTRECPADPAAWHLASPYWLPFAGSSKPTTSNA